MTFQVARMKRMVAARSNQGLVRSPGTGAGLAGAAGGAGTGSRREKTMRPAMPAAIRSGSGLAKVMWRANRKMKRPVAMSTRQAAMAQGLRATEGLRVVQQAMANSSPAASKPAKVAQAKGAGALWAPT